MKSKSINSFVTLLLSSTLFVGCGLAPSFNARMHSQPATPSIPVVPPVRTDTQKPTNSNTKVPHHRNKNHKMKKVEDKNYSDTYMYPEDNSSAKKDPIQVNPATPTPSTSSMTKEECISMIGEAKFTKYTQMLGSEASSIKRCSMLKAMK
jgi:hypothetical protein